MSAGILFGPFHVDATPRNPTEKNAVYVRGLNPPVWVAINEDLAKEGARRLNAAYSAGALKGWNERGADGVLRKGWSMDDLISASKGGEPTRAAIKAAGTLMKAIAAVANGRTAFK